MSFWSECIFLFLFLAVEKASWEVAASKMGQRMVAIMSQTLADSVAEIQWTPTVIC